MCVTVDRAFVVLYVFSINTCPRFLQVPVWALWLLLLYYYLYLYYHTITITITVLRHCALREYNSYFTCTVQRLKYYTVYLYYT